MAVVESLCDILPLVRSYLLTILSVLEYHLLAIQYSPLSPSAKYRNIKVAVSLFVMIMERDGRGHDES